MYRWEFGKNGLVSEAFVQPDKLIDGVDALAALNPRLMLDISAFKNAKSADAVGAISLAAFEEVSLPAVSDKQLATVAPALKGVRKLRLMCRGFADANFTPVGLRAVADQVKGLKGLSIDFYRSVNEGTGRAKAELPALTEYVDLIVSHPGFAELQSIHIPGAKPKAFASLKKLSKVKTSW